MQIWRCRSGNIAIMTAMLLPALLAAGGVAVDLYMRGAQRMTLQEFADQLALRGAREFLLANAQVSQVESVIRATAASELPAQLGVGEFDLSVSIDPATFAVTVTLAQDYGKTKLLPDFAGPAGFDVSSTALARGGSKICVVALEESDDRAIEASWYAKMRANQCSVLSNSTGSAGVYASGSAKITAEMICSAGGKSGTASNFDPDVTTDCPVYEDPLAARPAPAVGACDHFDLLVGDRSIETFTAAISLRLAESTSSSSADDDDGATTAVSSGDFYQEFTLDPGVYCGGLDIASNADVTLNPGVYIMKDGPLVVDFNARIEGRNVGFYMTGTDAQFYFGAESDISLTAPKTGPLAGILFFEDRNAPEGRVHRIQSNDARTLLGTFYLPQGVFSVESLQPVADQSAYTAIVAKRVRMSGSPTLVLNSNYRSTDIPVPEGVGPVGGMVMLRE